MKSKFIHLYLAPFLIFLQIKIIGLVFMASYTFYPSQKLWHFFNKI
ncbi:MAG: hypothetical protein UR28_C0008G0017 [Candidatus Peregrinibacteria bacterium GW2011_GWF2_33_10]|nr:MAG: hypothetical protein UR28_C0008G0017 [Candidatus Peregrinibacteria bacterium GW2011_GWF2_33_10]